MMPCFLWNLHVFFKQDDCRLYVMSQEINVSQSRFKCKLQALIKSKKMRVRSIFFFFFSLRALLCMPPTPNTGGLILQTEHTHTNTQTHICGLSFLCPSVKWVHIASVMSSALFFIKVASQLLPSPLSADVFCVCLCAVAPSAEHSFSVKKLYSMQEYYRKLPPASWLVSQLP